MPSSTKAVECTGILVSGCGVPSMAEIVNGSYKAHGENNGKPVFRREKDYMDTAVLVYFWEEADSPDQSGWWFAPSIGDDFAWAQNCSRATLKERLPPETGWHVPHDGGVDPNMRVKRRMGDRSSDKR